MITILSIPRTGTRFWYHFVTRILKLDARYAHFSAKTVDAITDYLDKTDDVIIVPVRGYEETVESAHLENRYLIDDATEARARFTRRLEEYGAHFMNTNKGSETFTQVVALLKDLDVDMTEEIREAVQSWRPIGSQHSNDPTSHLILREMLKCKALCKTT
jgi:hypothetical protein